MDPLTGGDDLRPGLRRADPREPALRPLVLRHLADMQAASPPGSSHALGPEALAEPGVAFFVLEEDGAPLAFGALKPLEPGHCELKSMHVLAEARGRGLGRRLLRALMAQAAADGMVRVSLETGRPPAYAAAVMLYLGEGFVECPPFADYRPDPASLFLTRRLD
jgi:putative acetyltransferase